MSAVSEYAELLKLIEISGPFLSLPIFKEVFPQGLVRDDKVPVHVGHPLCLPRPDYAIA